MSPASSSTQILRENASLRHKRNQITKIEFSQKKSAREEGTAFL